MTSGARPAPEGKQVSIYWEHEWYDYMVDPEQVRFMTPEEKDSTNDTEPVIENETGKWLKCSFMLSADRVGTQGQIVQIMPSGSAKK